ncbi:hypothetical protein VTN02DRAFT_2074 [Thermoascus thermophilus]
MWKRIQITRSREPHIGNPTLIETTFDEKTLQAMKGIPGSKRSDGAVSHKDSKDLPALPQGSRDSNSGKPYAGPRVASSGYPHTNRDIGYSGSQGRSYSDTYGSRGESPDISPPDSPLCEAESHESPDISPIDEEPDCPFQPFQKETRFSSHLPVLRKTAPGKTAESSASGPLSKNLPSGQKNSRTRSDDLSGEPSDSGKAAQVTPDDTPFHSRPAKTQHYSLFGKGKGQVLSKKRLPESGDKGAKDNCAVMSPPREPWRGPTGRSAIVYPIQEKPGAKLPSIVRDNRSSTARKPLYSSQGLTAQLGFVPATVTTTITGGLSGQESDVIKPVAPLKDRSTNSVSKRSPAVQVKAEKSIGSSVSGGRDCRPEQAVSSVSSDDTIRPIKPPGNDFAAKLENVTLGDRTSSSLSATTYTTADSADVGAWRISPNPSSSVMSRGRPIPSAVASMKSTIRKPTPSQRSVSDTATSKDLPQSPPEMKARSRIDALEAKRDDLARRRANINSIIRELTQVVQPTASVAQDMAARNEVKKTVANLNDELAEIKRQEHEIGVKLLRAWKRHDEEDKYSNGSGLWVKRVTS